MQAVFFSICFACHHTIVVEILIKLRKIFQHKYMHVCLKQSLNVCAPFNEFPEHKSTTVEVIFNVLQIYLWHEFKNIQQTFQCYISMCERKKNEWCLLKLSLNCDFQRSLIHFFFQIKEQRNYMLKLCSE